MPVALPVSPHRRPPPAAGGFLLLEALVALGVLTVGILPAAWLGPAALQRWQRQTMTAQAIRIASEAAELTALAGTARMPLPPPLPAVLPLASLRDARGLPAPRWCVVPPSGSGGACPPGPRIVVVGPLPDRAGTRASPAWALQTIALWVRP